LARVDYSNFETGESILLPLSQAENVVVPAELLTCFVWTGCQRQQLWACIGCRAPFTD